MVFVGHRPIGVTLLPPTRPMATARCLLHCAVFIGFTSSDGA
jgi:hypothetical protein